MEWPEGYEVIKTTETRIDCNNGCVIAERMHQRGELQNGLSCDDYYKSLKAFNPNCKWLESDQFWEDFCYTVGELGYELKC